MPVYVALLRAVNLGAHNRMKMSRLQEVCAGLGFARVATYIQSGNVVFSLSKGSAAAASKMLEKAIRREFCFDVRVFCRSAEEMGAVIRRNPLAKVKGIDTGKLHVSFLSEVPVAAAVKKLESFAAGGEQLRCAGTELYLYCPQGYGRSKLANLNVERVLKVAATTRNWRTVNTLAAMAEKVVGAQQ